MGKKQQTPCPIGDVDLEAPVSAAARFLSAASGVSGDASTTTEAASTTDASTGSSNSTTTGAASTGDASTGSSNSTDTTSDDSTTVKTSEVDAALSRFGPGALAASVAAVWAGMVVAH